jgi:hypothetical protein
MLFEGDYRFEWPSTLDASAFPSSVYSTLVAGDGSGPPYPRELYPDAYVFTKDLAPDAQPMKVHFVPKGSWLVARLAFLAKDAKLLAEALVPTRDTIGNPVFSLALDVCDVATGKSVGRVSIIFSFDEIRVEGRAEKRLDRKIVHDLGSILFAGGLRDVAVCKYALEGKDLGWNGKKFLGEGMRKSRFALIREDDKAYEKLAKRRVKLPTGDDSAASDPKVLAWIADYLALETADGEYIEGNLQYIRSATIDDAHYSIWEYHESDGTKCFVTLSDGPNGAVLGMRDAWKFTPEQYIYGDFHELL